METNPVIKRAFYALDMTSTDIVIPDSSPSPFSPLWNSEIRKDVKKSKIPEKDLNELRSQQRVPGTKLDLGYDTPRIPVLIIQQPGNEGKCYMGFVGKMAAP